MLAGIADRGRTKRFWGRKEETTQLHSSREDHKVLECFFLPHGLGSRRDFAGKKRGERTLAGGA